ncbi:MAG: helix-turn-helix domain-containing protein [Chloroflexi bacterium]|nr:helix-turn-helix domain-containing protein [Chloroflexota bacterium]
MSITHKIGLRIKELRKAENITQEGLALKANIDRTYINSVENGRRNISIINLEKICVALNVEFKDFFNSDCFIEYRKRRR